MAAFVPQYERWRHGGYYVTNITYPSGAVGCVHNNKGDGRWYIACGDHQDISFSTRDDAAKAEYIAVSMMKGTTDDDPATV